MPMRRLRRQFFLANDCIVFSVPVLVRRFLWFPEIPVELFDSEVQKILMTKDIDLHSIQEILGGIHGRLAHMCSELLAEVSVVVVRVGGQKRAL